MPRIKVKLVCNGFRMRDGSFIKGIDTMLNIEGRAGFHAGHAFTGILEIPDLPHRYSGAALKELRMVLNRGYCPDLSLAEFEEEVCKCEDSQATNNSDATPTNRMCRKE